MKTRAIRVATLYLLYFQSYFYSPYAFSSHWQPSIGTGVDFSETQSYRTCINHVRLAKTPLALSRLYKEARIESRKDLNEVLNVSATVSAKSQWGNGGGSVSYFSDLEMRDESFYWVVDANYAVTSEKIINNESLELNSVAKSILRNQGLQAFYAACGTHFYSGRQLGGRYSLVYEFESREDRFIEQIKASANYGGFGLKAKASFSKFLDLAEQASILKIHARIVGGDDSIKSYANDAEQLEAELAKLRKGLLENKLGVPLQWFLTSYDIFEDVLAKKREENLSANLEDLREDTLGYFYTLYSQNSQNRSRLLRLLQASDMDDPLYVYSPEARVVFNEAIQKYDEQNDAISMQATSCLRWGRCSRQGLQVLSLTEPKPMKDLSHFGSWDVLPFVYKREGEQLFLKLVGDPGAHFNEQLFGQDDYRIFSIRNEVYLLGRNPWNGTGQLRIGSADLIRDPRSGKMRPNLCMGDYEAICNIRIVEGSSIGSDGYPISKMILSVFDANGFVDKRHVMYTAL